MPAVRGPLVATLATAAALLAAGCEDESPRTGEEEHVRNTAETLLRLCAESNATAIPAMLTPATDAIFISAGGPLEGCQAVLRLTDEPGVPDPEVYDAARIVAVQRRGGQASVRIRSRNRESTIHLEDTGQRWLISNPPMFTPVSELRDR